MPESVVIKQVSSPEDYRAFFEFPWTLYRDDPNWVPNLISARREQFDRKKGAAWEYMDGEYFTAWRGQTLVGTVAALVNHRHNEYTDENVGWFGAFEVVNDPEVAQALLDTASAWVRARGCTAIRGPQTFTTHEECGLLIENFSRPVLLMAYNPPYYRDLIEGAGFEPAMDVVSLYIDKTMVAETDLRERLDKLASRVRQRSKIVIRPIDTRRLKEEFQLFKDLYNAAWSRNWGFVPMTERELDALVESLGQFFDPSLAFFAEVDGKSAGFALALPDFNEVLQAAYPRPGTPEILTLAKALYYWKIKRVIRGMRIPLIGVKEEFRNRGVELALLHAETEAMMQNPYFSLDAGWILESNSLVDIGKKLEAKIYKTHRFYEQAWEV